MGVPPSPKEKNQLYVIGNKFLKMDLMNIFSSYINNTLLDRFLGINYSYHSKYDVTMFFTYDNSTCTPKNNHWRNDIVYF